MTKSEFTPDQIKAAREEMALSREQLAVLLRGTASSVYRWESPIGTKGHKRMLGAAQVALAHLLNRHRRGLPLDIMPETNIIAPCEKTD